MWATRFLPMRPRCQWLPDHEKLLLSILVVVSILNQFSWTDWDVAGFASVIFGVSTASDFMAHLAKQGFQDARPWCRILLWRE